MEILISFLVILTFVLLLALCVAIYVVNAVGLMRVAKQSGVKHAWLAWLPVIKVWVLGATAQAFDAKRGINRKWGKTLLGLYIVGYVIYMPAYIGIICYAFIQSMAYNTSVYYDPTVMLSGFATILVIFYCILLISALVLIVAGAIQYVCLYKIFEGFVPEKSLKYFVLSLLVPMAMGICFIKCCPKNKDINLTGEIPSAEN